MATILEQFLKDEGVSSEDIKCLTEGKEGFYDDFYNKFKEKKKAWAEASMSDKLAAAKKEGGEEATKKHNGKLRHLAKSRLGHTAEEIDAAFKEEENGKAKGAKGVFDLIKTKQEEEVNKFKGEGTADEKLKKQNKELMTENASLKDIVAEKTTDYAKLQTEKEEAVTAAKKRADDDILSRNVERAEEEMLEGVEFGAKKDVFLYKNAVKKHIRENYNIVPVLDENGKYKSAEIKNKNGTPVLHPDKQNTVWENPKEAAAWYVAKQQWDKKSNAGEGGEGGEGGSGGGENKVTVKGKDFDFSQLNERYAEAE